jgi:hypothetical protein
MEVNRERHRDKGCREEVVERAVHTRRDGATAQEAEQILHVCPFPMVGTNEANRTLGRHQAAPAIA